MVIPSAPTGWRAFLRRISRAGPGSTAASAAHRAPPPTAELLLFHTARYVDFVRARSADGQGSLDAGDTPAFPRLFRSGGAGGGRDARCRRRRCLSGEAERAFVPIAGLHHAARDGAAGFCIFNDCGVLIEMLRRGGIARVAYVDIDAHHGDGVFYAFEADPQRGIRRPARGRPVPVSRERAGPTRAGTGAGAGQQAEHSAAARFRTTRYLRWRWPEVIAHLARLDPQFIILQCGADSLAGDPITHLQLTRGQPRAGGRASCARWPTGWGTDACWRWAVAATTAPISPRLECGGGSAACFLTRPASGAGRFRVPWAPLPEGLQRHVFRVDDDRAF